MLRLEHIEVGRTLYQHVDDGTAARTHMVLDVLEHFERARLREEHQQSDRNDRVELLGDPIRSEIDCLGLDRQPSGAGNLPDPCYSAHAAVERGNRAATPPSVTT